MACTTETTEAPAAAVDPVAEAEATVMAAADAYIDAWFRHFPEMATFYRVEGKTHDRLTDNTAEGRAAWQAVEDRLLADLASVDAGVLEGSDAWLPYGILLERLEASVRRHRALPVDLLGGALLQDVKDFSGLEEFDDDVCVLSIEMANR